MRTITATKSACRHDLDALRVVAMLLGIVLHIALAFAPIPWIVQDTPEHLPTCASTTLTPPAVEGGSGLGLAVESAC